MKKAREMNPFAVVDKLAESRDKAMLIRRLNIYRINFRESTLAGLYFNNLERILRIRR